MSAGIPYLPAPRLTIEIVSNETTNFGPSDVVGRVKANARARLRISDAVSAGFSWYSRFPSNAFWTLRQDSVNNLDLNPGLDHVRMWLTDPTTGYGPKLVFNGRLGDPDASGEDVVWTAWGYLAELALSRSGYKVDYKNKKLGSKIITDEWSRDDGGTGKFNDYGAKVQNKGLSRHIATGTIEDPLNVAGTMGIRTDAQFGVIDVPRLLLFFDLTEMGRANTLNNVTFGITRDTAPEFFFLKNAGTNRPRRALRFPGNILDFRYVPGVLNVRNDLATIGTKEGSPVEIKKEVTGGSYGINTFGRRQDTFTIKTLAGYPGMVDPEQMFDSQEKLTQRAVNEASQLTRALRIDVRPEMYQIADGWEIEDTVPVRIKKGRTNINGTYRIVGYRGMMDERGYTQSLILTLPTA